MARVRGGGPVRVASGEGRSSDPDFLGRLTLLTFRENEMRVCPKNREFASVKRLPRPSICRSAAIRCGDGSRCLFARLLFMCRAQVVARGPVSETDSPEVGGSVEEEGLDLAAAEEAMPRQATKDL